MPATPTEEQPSASDGPYSILDRIDQENDQQIDFKLVMGEQHKLKPSPKNARKKEVLVVRKVKRNMESEVLPEMKAVGTATTDDNQVKSALI